MTGRNRNHRSRDPFAAYPRAAGSRWDEDMLAMSDEALALLGASLEPVEPPASLRAELLERIRPKEEPAEGLIRHAEQVFVAPFAPLIVCSTRHARRFAVTGVLRSVVPVQPRHDSAPISLRSRAIPFLILVLTVPSGTPVRRAISVWVRPVK